MWEKEGEKEDDSKIFQLTNLKDRAEIGEGTATLNFR